MREDTEARLTAAPPARLHFGGADGTPEPPCGGAAPWGGLPRPRGPSWSCCFQKGLFNVGAFPSHTHFLFQRTSLPGRQHHLLTGGPIGTSLGSGADFHPRMAEAGAPPGPPAPSPAPHVGAPPVPSPFTDGMWGHSHVGRALGRKETPCSPCQPPGKERNGPGVTQPGDTPQAAAGHLGLPPGLWSPRFPAQSSEPPQGSAGRAGCLLAARSPSSSCSHAAMRQGQEGQQRPARCGTATSCAKRQRGRAPAWHGNGHRGHSMHQNWCFCKQTAG